MRWLALAMVIVLGVLTCATDRDDEQESKLRNLPAVQSFEITVVRDTIIFGKDGVRVFIPAHCFVNNKGKVVKGDIQINLIEAIDLADQLLVDAVGDGEVGLARVEAWQNGEPLKLSPTARLLVQFPLEDSGGAYEMRSGEVRKNGKVRWRKGEKAASFLIPTNFSHLPFHPEAFKDELAELLPFGEFREYSIGLADSLYFSYAGGEVLELIEDFRYTKMNEPYYNKRRVFQNGEYTDGSYEHGADGYASDMEGWPLTDASCGIDPARVQVLKSPEFAKSALATAAFAKRLSVILSIGAEALLDIYIKHLDRDLWESDQAAADYLRSRDDARYETFQRFATQGLTNTEGGEAYAELLNQTMTVRMAAFAEELKEKRAAIQTALAKENLNVDQLKEEYRQLLWSREQHRMEHLTFALGDLGWYWPHRKVKNAVDTVVFAKLAATIAQADRYDEVYVYNVLPDIKSIYRLETRDGETFYPGSADEERMYQYLHREADVVAVAYRNEKMFVGRATYVTGKNNEVTLQLKPGNRRQLRKLLNATTGYTRANDIRIDLPYARALAAESNRQNALWEQQYALYFLGAKAYPNCNMDPTLAEAKVLFKQHCASCHHTNLRNDLTGPALINSPRKYTKMWFTRFTENSQHMIVIGDPQAMKLWREWGPTVMNSFAGKLSKAEIGAIFKYIEASQ